MNRSLTDNAAARNVRVDGYVAQMHRTDRAALVHAIEQRDMAELERAGIAQRIKEARQEAGLSQLEMAAALDVIPRTYQNYESLTQPRTPWNLMGQIATVTGKSTEWLIHGDKPETPDLMARINNNGAGERLTAIEERLDQALAKIDELALNNAAMGAAIALLVARSQGSDESGEAGG